MKRRTFAIILSSCALFTTLLVLSLNAILDKNRERFQEEIQSALGRPLTFERLGLSLWDGLGLAAKNLRVAEDARFAATPFIQTKELRMVLRWLPLFLGEIKIKTLIFDEPEIQIIRNEAGDLNISALADSENGAQGGSSGRKEKKGFAPELLISAIRIEKGKADYIDRSVKEPIEITIRNLDLELRGLSAKGTIRLKLLADLLGSQAQNMRVEGRIWPSGRGKAWTQYPMDLQIRVDPLLFPQLTRAIPLLRESASPYLDIRGPLTVKTRLRGTIERPRLSDLLLTGPFFGSTQTNLKATGELDFSQGQSWTEAAIKGDFLADPASLQHLKKIPFLQELLPGPLSSDGPLSITGELQGSLADLKVHTRIKADESEVRYGEWLKKAKGVPASVELKMVWQKERTIFEPSALTLHNLKLQFSGRMEGAPERALALRLRTEKTDLTGWEKILSPLSSYDLGGKVQFDLWLQRSPQDQRHDIQGQLDFSEVEARDKKSGYGIERFSGRVAFRGKEATMEGSSLRLGSSDLSLEASVPDLSQPLMRYTLRSARLNLAELTGTPDEMKAFLGTGEIEVEEGAVTARGNLLSLEGTVQQIPYRNLRAEAAWSPKGLRFEQLWLQALGGNLQAAGALEIAPDGARRLSLEARLDSVDLKTLAAQKFPDLKEQIEGRLYLKARLRGEGKDGSSLRENLQGEGEVRIRNGSLKGLNLVQGVLSQAPGLRDNSDRRSSRQPSSSSTLLVRPGTSFDLLKAAFTLEPGRLRSQNLTLTTPDYSIYGEGWIGWDRSMNWDARLVISPELTRDLIQEWKNIRTPLDPKGRIAIPFRLEGTLPRVQPKPEFKGWAEVPQ